MNAGQTPTEEDYQECGACKHYPAYHVGGPCRAWDPESGDFKCACPKWTSPKPLPAAPPETSA